MKSLQSMLAFMTICAVALNTRYKNDGRGYQPTDSGCKSRRQRDMGDGMTIKQKKARKRAKNNKRKCTKR